ncbi:MAG TPA: glycosyltransferase family 1 protein [Methylomirabilota bacterium]|nr:glycosyltransferase family 1 protein [Methylomirabilota bacterium]
MPKVGVDGRELRPGVRSGIRRYLVEVLRALSRAGWPCVVYGDRGSALDEALPGVAARVLPGSWTQVWDQVSLPRALREDGASVFLSPYYKGPLRAPCPVVLTIHDLYFIAYPGRPRPLRDAVLIRVARLYARRAAAIVADSEHSRRQIVARLRIDPARVTVIPVALGREFTPAAPAAGVRYGITSSYILYVGNFRPHKNLPRLLAAYAALPAPLRAAHALVLAGGDRAGRPALEALARELGVADRVVFPGLVDDRDLPGLYAGATAAVLPSLEEGFGLPALEAMACGTPVVVSNRGALPELVAEAGLVADAERPADLAGALARVLADPGVRAELRRRGLARAGLYTAERTAGRVLDLLRRVAEGRR